MPDCWLEIIHTVVNINRICLDRTLIVWTTKSRSSQEDNKRKTSLGIGCRVLGAGGAGTITRTVHKIRREKARKARKDKKEIIEGRASTIC
jgi:hypothetical protein